MKRFPGGKQAAVAADDHIWETFSAMPAGNVTDGSPHILSRHPCNIRRHSVISLWIMAAVI